MAEIINRYELRNRYVFTGKLVMLTAFHIGGGVGRMTTSGSDSPVVLTSEGVPFIPGSSFKGALRSAVEKLVPVLPGDWFSCSLIQLSDKEAKEAQRQNMRICSTAWSDDLTKKKRSNPAAADEVREEMLDRLCNTCKLFGSPIAASRVNVNDLYMPLDEWNEVIQIRDGVAIDRDSERAKDKLKYDFEVVPGGATFNLEITLENATQQDVQLLCIGLSEYVHGFGAIGGKRSRGLGACRLDQLHVFSLDLTDVNKRNQRMRNYLLERERERKFSGSEDGESFLNRHISQIFETASL